MTAWQATMYAEAAAWLETPADQSVGDPSTAPSLVRLGHSRRRHGLIAADVRTSADRTARLLPGWSSASKPRADTPGACVKNRSAVGSRQLRAHRGAIASRAAWLALSIN